MSASEPTRMLNPGRILSFLFLMGFATQLGT